MYDHSRQYRCDIIRGKSQKEMDDLLPAYAKVIDEICPCGRDEFESRFNSAFARFLPEKDRVKKTLDNHRTEISGKLFGMYYYSDDGSVVYVSERTRKFLADNDQPAFFKDICYKMQFPNGMQKPDPTVIARVSDGICLRPCAFVLRLLQVAEERRIVITKKTLGYYVLNSLDVLQGHATPEEVLEAVLEDQRHGLVREIHSLGEDGKEKAGSYKYQHINEQINYLELANLIRLVENASNRHDKRVVLNPKESGAIAVIAAGWDRKPLFDVASCDLSTPEARKEFLIEWDAYYGQLSPCVDEFTTSIDALTYTGIEETDVPEAPAVPAPEHGGGESMVALGDEGEDLVYRYERNRVAGFNARLVNKVLALGKTRGLGYDIQSVIAEPGDRAEFVKYIEVKSTKRLTCPDINDELWVDTLNMTRNEWVAAQQHGEYYSIFRVYFTREGVTIFVLSNVKEKIENNHMQATPTMYRVDFSKSAVDLAVVL